MAFEVLDSVQFGQFPMGATPVGRYRFVDISSTGTLEAIGAEGAIAFGVVCLDNAEVGQATKVQVGGIARVEASATVTIGQVLQCASTGTVLPALTGDYTVGRAVTGGASGELISVVVDCSNVPLA